MITDRRRQRTHAQSYRPIVERLEDRTLPSSTTAGLTLTPADAATQAQVSAAYGQVPLSFEVNEGQTASSVNFLAHGAGYTLFLTPTGSTLALEQPSTSQSSDPTEDAVQMQLAGANPTPTVTGLNLQTSVSNYLVGNDSSQWQTNIPNYGEVEYQNVYQGVNLVYYGNNSQLEYDFVVAPGANPGVISMNFQGALSTQLDGQGNLILQTSGGELVEQAPVLYQMIDGVRHNVSGNFVLQGNGQVGFSVGAYDPSQPLTIDPVLLYSTYFGGGGGDEGWGVAVDKTGDAYIIGATTSTNLPVLHDYQGPDLHGGQYVFVTKFDPAGNALVFSTYFGGTSQGPGSSGAANRGFGIAVDSADDIYITGDTFSSNLPTRNAYQPHAATSSIGLTEDAFVAKLDPAGSALIYSTYLGGAGTDSGRSIAVDSQGYATVVGVTAAPLSPDIENFPTFNAFQPIYGGGTSNAFIARFGPTGDIVYSSYLGGSGADGAGADPQAVGGGNFVALDSAGNAYVTGFTSSTDFPTLNAVQPHYGGGDFDAFVAEVSPTGTKLFATYLGGSGIDIAHGIAVNGLGDIYVTGQTQSTDFPGPLTYQTVNNTGGSGDNAFVTEYSPGGASIIFSTYLGGSDDDIADAIAVDAFGDIYITGTATSLLPTGNGNIMFPLVDAMNLPSNDNGDIFVAKFNPTGTALIYSTLIGDASLGGDSDTPTGIALDAEGNAYIVGYTESQEFPTVHPYQSIDKGGLGVTTAFLTKIGEQVVTHFQVQITPPANAGTPISVTVTALDASGDVVQDYQGTVHLLSSDPLAVLPADYTFTLADAGSHTFDVTLETAGLQSITVFDVAAPSATGSATVTVNPSVIAGFDVTGFPSSILSGVAHTFTVVAVDQFGNRVTNYTGTVTLSSSVGGGAFSLPTYTFKTTDKGEHTFTATLDTRGPQSIMVTDSINNVSGEEDNIVVSPATHFTITVAPGTTFTAGDPFTITVTAFDARNETDTAYAGTVAFTSTDPQVSPSNGLPANTAFGAGGIMQFNVTLDTAGSRTITVTDANNKAITGKVTVTVVANSAYRFLVTGYPTITTIGGSHPFTITAADEYGNPTSFLGQVTFSSSDSMALFNPATYTFVAADKGKHVINAIFNTRGSQSLTVKDTATGQITGTESGILVSPATHLSAVGSTITPTAGVSFTVTVIAHDAANLIDTAFLDTVHVSTTDAAAEQTPGDIPANYAFVSGDAGVYQFTITLATAGTQKITFTDTTRSTVLGTLTVTVERGPVSQFEITGYPADALVNTPHTFTVTAVDAGGNRITNYTGTVTFSGAQGLPASYQFVPSNAGQHTFTASFSAPGNETLGVSDTNSNSGSDTVTVYALTAGISGPTVAVPGQPLAYVFTASTTALPASVLFTYHISWNGVLQTIKGPNGITVPYTFTTTGTPIISVTVVDASGVSSAPATLNVTVTTVAMETDPGNNAQTDLVVGGSTGNNTIDLLPTNAAGTSILVSVNGSVQGTFAPTGHILVYGQAGNDTIQEMTATVNGVNTFITIPAVLDGGAGNDTLIAAGSSAPNILLGLAGKDVLIGGTGRNILIGGSGASTLYGGGADDILIPGTTSYDTNLTALFAIMDEWNSAATPYATRVAQLLGTLGAGGLNGSYFLDSATVQRIAADDVMYGERGNDWFFFTSKGAVVDQIKEKSPGDIITPL